MVIVATLTERTWENMGYWTDDRRTVSPEIGMSQAAVRKRMTNVARSPVKPSSGSVRRCRPCNSIDKCSALLSTGEEVADPYADADHERNENDRANPYGEGSQSTSKSGLGIASSFAHLRFFTVHESSP